MPMPYQTTCRECGAPRDPHAHTARCTLHEAEYKRQKTQKHRASNPGYSTYHARMMDYRRMAREAGADEVEAAWLMMACEIEFERKPRSSGWVRPFIAQEISYLRASAGTFAKLDAARWAAPTGDQAAVVVDDGYELEDAS
jgi:hypothetical protein